jgi:hypothetical protein
MSLFKGYRQGAVIHDGMTANLGTTIDFPIRNRGWWLEGIMLTVTARLGAAVSGYKANGLLGVIKGVELQVNERDDGNRSVVSVGENAGMLLAELAAQELGFFDQRTCDDNFATGANDTVVKAVVPILFRNPLFPEPVAYRTCLPLPRYGADPVLRVTLETAANIATTFTTETITGGALGNNVRIDALMLYRDVVDPDGSFPHWKTEVASHKKVWSATGKQADEDIPAGGLFTGILTQHYLAAGTRQTVQASAYTDEWALEVAMRNVFQGSDAQLRSLNDLSRGPMMSGAGTSLFGQLLFGGFFMDFISDVTMTDTFHLRSALDANLEALRGGKIRLIASNIGAANNYTHVLHRKLLLNASDVLGVTL